MEMSEQTYFILIQEAIKISNIIKDALNPECGLKHEVGMRTHMMPKGV